MDELKYLLAGLDIYIYLGLLLSFLIVIKYKPAYAASFFIWGCSIPLSAFCYLSWVYASGGGWDFVIFLVEAFAFAQIGWLGGVLALAGKWINTCYLKKAGLWVSMVSVFSHGLFLGGILVFGYGSS